MGKRKFIAILGFFILLVGIPATLYLSQKTQEERSRASASTTLYLTPSSSVSSPEQGNVGDKMSFDVMVNPGTNIVSFVKLVLIYDPTKFKADSNSFTSNPNAFPSLLSGPAITNGSIAVSLSIGSNPTGGIQTATKAGTITLTAIAPTNATPTTISFGSNTQVLSAGPNDQSSENVLSTTTPAYVLIAGTTPSPSIVSTVAPTNIPSITPSPGAGTTLAFTLFLHDIGNFGDNVNPASSSASNKNPQHPQREITAFVMNASNQIVASQSGTVTYDSNNGNYTGTVSLGNLTSNGPYRIAVQTASHLRRLVPGIQTIQPNTTVTLPSVDLVAGDINGDNQINILDYNILIGCYSDLAPAQNCNATNQALADLNDDGAVNQFDYNLFLRELSSQPGD